MHTAQSCDNKLQSKAPSRGHNRVNQSGISQRSAKQKDICDPYISTAIGITNSLRHSAARDSNKGNVQQSQPHINPEQQSETTADDTVVSTRTVQPRSPPRKLVWHSRTSTAITRAKAHLAQPADDVCMSPLQHNNSATRKHNETSGISTTTSKVTILLGHTAVSRRAVYQPRGKMYIWHSCISTVPCMTRDHPSESILAQLYINNGQNTKATALLDDTRSRPPERYIHRDQHNKGKYFAAVYRQRPKSTSISNAKAHLVQLYINRDQQNKYCLAPPDINSNQKPTMSTRVGYQLRSGNQEHIWHSFISLARNSYISTAIKN